MALSDERIRQLLEMQMSRWERLEKWLSKHQIKRFTAEQLADSLGEPVSEASAMIQSYLGAQRREGSAAVYHLRREGRTRAASWYVGDRMADVRATGGTLLKDMTTKAKHAYALDLKHIAARNPRARPYVEAKIEAVLAGALVVLQQAVDFYGDEEDED